MATHEQHPIDKRVEDSALPPLEPTAEVPAIHSDKLNDPAYWAEKQAAPSARVPKEHRDDKNNKKPSRFSLRTRIGAGVTAVVVGGGGLLWVTQQGGESDTEPKAEPSASAPAIPGEAGSTASANISPESEINTTPTELSVERYKDGDSLVRAFNSEYNTWMMSGANDANAKDLINHLNEGMDGYTDSLAGPLDDEFVDTLFISDWQERPQLAEYINSIKNQHHSILAIYLSTTGSGDPADVQSYQYDNQVTSTNIVSASPSEMVVQYRYLQEDNSDQNRANEIYSEPASGMTGGGTLTFTNVDGYWKISDNQHFAG